MSNMARPGLPKGLIIPDDIAIYPILDFNSYRDAILEIIRNSHPKFTIGIFGDWGTGKTTLMDSVKRELEPDKNTITVQFETWRYEREEQFVLIPLLKTIAFALPDEQKFEKLREKLKRGTTNLLKRTPDIASAIVSKFLGEKTGEITKDVMESFKHEFNSKVELLAEVDRDTLYFDGFEDIRSELKKIMKENDDFRIVVFVDDLDRCSPKKTLEVLESIKVFLGMEGFIYVVGISHDVITKLIDIEYENKGVKGEQYIKKMIQIPITLPKWNNSDISELVKDFVRDDLIHWRYKDTIKENADLISKAVENSPRELKRFLNNFIVAYEIFSRSEHIEFEDLLVIQAIQIRWYGFYDLLVKKGTTLTNELKKYIDLSDEDRTKKLESEDRDADLDYSIKLKLRDYKSNMEFWDFVKEHSNLISGIQDFAPYRRATESTKDVSNVHTAYEDPIETSLVEAKKLLKELSKMRLTGLLDEVYKNLEGIRIRILDDLELFARKPYEFENLKRRRERMNDIRQTLSRTVKILESEGVERSNLAFKHLVRVNELLNNVISYIEYPSK